VSAARTNAHIAIAMQIKFRTDLVAFIGFLSVLSRGCT
jgi:hypothetical protein